MFADGALHFKRLSFDDSDEVLSRSVDTGWKLAAGAAIEIAPLSYACTSRAGLALRVGRAGEAPQAPAHRPHGHVQRGGPAGARGVQNFAVLVR